MTSYFLALTPGAPTNLMGTQTVLRSGRIKRIRYCISVVPTANGAGGVCLQVGLDPVMNESPVQTTVIDTRSATVFQDDTATQAMLSTEGFSGTTDVDFAVALGTPINVNAFALGTAVATLAGNIIFDVVD